MYVSINFKQYEQPQKEVPANSEVLKALLEQENQIGGVAGLPEFQEDRKSNFFSKNWLGQPKNFTYLSLTAVFFFLFVKIQW